MADVSTRTQQEDSPVNVFGPGDIELPGAEEVRTQDVSLDETGETESAETRDEQRRVESEARDAGWVPQDEWRGAKEKWKPATEYLDFRDHVLPVVQKENADLRRKLEAFERRESEQRVAQEARDREIAKITLKQELKLAREEGDETKEEQILDKILDLRVKEIVQPRPQAGQEVNPALRSEWEGFYAKNEWLKDDTTLKRRFGVEISKNLASGAFQSLTDALDDAKDVVKRLYPERFNRGTPMAEGGGSHGAARSGNGRSWSDLKPEARESFETVMDDLGLKGDDRKASMRRMLSQCDPEHFRR